MVVDEELHALLGRFDGRRTLKRVLLGHSKAWGKPVERLAAEFEAVLPDLIARGILTATPGRALRPDPEPLSIANLTLNLTNRCNLRCPFCYNSGRRTEELPAETLMEAVEAARPVFEPGATFIVLGGEPLLDPPRLWVALDRAAKVFSSQALLSTNGTLLTPDTVAGLAGRAVEVQVSLDSPDPARHDAGRGQGVHAKAVAGVERLVAAGVPTILSMVYTSQSAAELEPFLELALALGVREARFIPLRLIGGGLSSRSLLPDQHATFTFLLEILGRRPELGKLLVRDWFSIMYTLCRYSARRTSCGIGRRVIFLDADGAVYPCPNHVSPELRCGDIRTTPLVEILKASQVMSGLRERYEVSRFTRCRECPFRHFCAGDCRGEVLALTGDPAAPSPHCSELRRVYTEMFWLLSEGDQRLGGGGREKDARSALAAFQ
jgi:radical SAM protein with 4Fe4S-binding SPASM domain